MPSEAGPELHGPRLPLMSKHPQAYYPLHQNPYLLSVTAILCHKHAQCRVLRSVQGLRVL